MPRNPKSITGWRAGMRVRFNANPASLMLYTRPPRINTEGTVTTVPLPGGRKTYMRGPGGGLVYVDWDGFGTMGVAHFDLERIS